MKLVKIQGNNIIDAKTGKSLICCFNESDFICNTKCVACEVVDMKIYDETFKEVSCLRGPFTFGKII